MDYTAAAVRMLEVFQGVGLQELMGNLMIIAILAKAAIGACGMAVVAGAAFIFEWGDTVLAEVPPAGGFPVWHQFMEGLKQTTWLEYIAVFAGIASVWFSKKENILVFPVGLISTTIYVYLSFKFDLIGEASVNIYYTVLSVYGWVLWARKNKRQEHVLHISFSNQKQWLKHLAFFATLYAIIYFCLVYLQSEFYPGVIPWADAFASATAYTGMWLMAKKKVESWYWWIATNITSIPLYFVKGLVFTSVYYVVLLLMAFAGLAEWKRRAHKAKLLAEV